MDVKEFIKNFVDQFDELDVNTITPDTEYMALEGWNSLVALSVIAMIDEEYDVTLKGNDIRNAITIQGLYDRVCEQI